MHVMFLKKHTFELVTDQGANRYEFSTRVVGSSKSSKYQRRFIDFSTVKTENKTSWLVA